MSPSLDDIFESVEESVKENADDVYSKDPSFRTTLRDSLEYYDEEYDDDAE